jgi:hypothetical protein
MCLTNDSLLLFITAVPNTKLCAWGEEDGTREEPGTLTQGGALFSLVPLVWESNPKLKGCVLRGAGGGGGGKWWKCATVCVYYCSTYYKAVLRETTSRGVCVYYLCERCVCLLLQYLLQSCSRGVGGGTGGHVLRETTSRGRCELVCPSRTNERGEEGYCVKEGGGEEGERERERAGEVRLYYSLGY